MTDMKLDDKDLEKASGGMINELDGSYSFYAGLVIYLTESKKSYVTVKYASNWVDGDFKVPVTFHAGKITFDTEIKAKNLQECADLYGCKYN